MGSEGLVTSDYRNRIKGLVTSHYQTTKRNRKQYSAKEARNKAGDIAGRLNNPSRFNFYLKCAWNLTDEYLDRVLRIALTKNDPVRYFSAAAAAEMRANS